MFPEEAAAAAIVAKVMGGTVGDPSGRHDAEITFPDGETIGLEVTQAMNQSLLGTWAAIGDTQGEEPAPELTRWWSIALVADAKVKDAHPIVREQLGILEGLGQTEVNWLGSGLPNPDAAVRGAEDSLKAVGVDHAYSLLPKDKGGYSFVVHQPGGWVDGADVAAAAEAEAFKSDNVEKLTLMTTDQAHLFVWIDYSQARTYAAMLGGLSPIPVPNLPPQLDVLWVAARRITDKGDWKPAEVMQLSRSGSDWVVEGLT